MLSQQNPAIEKAVGVLKVLSGDEQIRMEAYYRERAIHDRLSQLDSAESKGRAEGRVEGKAEGRAEGKAEGEAQKAREIAKNLLSLGLDIKEIQAATGLTKEEIQQMSESAAPKA